MACAAVQRDLAADIHAAIDQVRTATPAGVLVVADVPAALPPVFADGARLHQMLVQLLYNAMAHTHTGTVTLHASAPPALAGAVRVYVADTGLGMTIREVEVRTPPRPGPPRCACGAAPHSPPRLQRVLLRPAPDLETDAVARKHVGFRLCLRRVRQLAELHGGTFRISSRPGAGTTVEFTLPEYDATLHSSSGGGGGGVGGGGGGDSPRGAPAYGLAEFERRCAPPLVFQLRGGGSERHLRRGARVQAAVALAIRGVARHLRGSAERRGAGRLAAGARAPRGVPRQRQRVPAPPTHAPLHARRARAALRHALCAPAAPACMRAGAPPTPRQ